MANNFLTPSIIASRALANLYETCVMANLVYRDAEDDFVGKQGDTITIRKPAVFEGREFTGAIELQDGVESGIPVQLNHFADVSFGVSSKELTLSIERFSEQLLDPAMEAIAQKIDRDTLTFRDDLTQTIGEAAANAEGEDYKGYNGNYPYSDSRVLIQAGAVLDRNNVPLGQRRVVVGPTTKSLWVAEKVWRESDKRGSTEGLLEASLGDRTSGFDPYMSQNIGQPAEAPVVGDPTTEVNVAFHRTAVALAFRPLELPPGAVNAAIANYNGFGLRVIMGYEMSSKKTIVSIDCLYGVKTLDLNRAVLIQGPLETV